MFKIHLETIELSSKELKKLEKLLWKSSRAESKLLNKWYALKDLKSEKREKQIVDLKETLKKKTAPLKKVREALSTLKKQGNIDDMASIEFSREEINVVGNVFKGSINRNKRNMKYQEELGDTQKIQAGSEAIANKRKLLDKMHYLDV